MKTINLFFDFEFTSLSPDAQPVSLGIVSDDIPELYGGLFVEPDNNKKNREDVAYRLNSPSTKEEELIAEKYIQKNNKSFYAEFSDFDINRCDDWVRENVVNKLKISQFKNVIPNGADNNEYEVMDLTDNGISYYGDTNSIIKKLKNWLSQFSDYQIQFISDCGTWDWYWMLQLLAEWDEIENEDGFTGVCDTCGQKGIPRFKTGLPKLPENISPVPEDLNDLIAFKVGISVKKAFDMTRDVLASTTIDDISEQTEYWDKCNKHNSLWDAKVIKRIYNKLK